MGTAWFRARARPRTRNVVCIPWMAPSCNQKRETSQNLGVQSTVLIFFLHCRASTGHSRGPIHRFEEWLVIRWLPVSTRYLFCRQVFGSIQVVFPVDPQDSFRGEPQVLYEGYAMNSCIYILYTVHVYYWLIFEVIQCTKLLLLFLVNRRPPCGIL